MLSFSFIFFWLHIYYRTIFSHSLVSRRILDMLLMYNTSRLANWITCSECFVNVAGAGAYANTWLIDCQFRRPYGKVGSRNSESLPSDSFLSALTTSFFCSISMDKYNERAYFPYSWHQVFIFAPTLFSEF